MFYCHECGEAISPKDIFCPYCGITIQAALTPPINLEESVMGKTEDKKIPAETPFPIPSEGTEEFEVVVEDVSLPTIPEYFSSDKQEDFAEIKNSALNLKDVSADLPQPAKEKTSEQIFTDSSRLNKVQTPIQPEVSVNSDVAPSKIESENELVNFDATIAYTHEDFIQNKLQPEKNPVITEEIPISNEQKFSEPEIVEEKEPAKAPNEDVKIKTDTNFANTLISAPLNPQILGSKSVQSELPPIQPQISAPIVKPEPLGDEIELQIIDPQSEDSDIAESRSNTKPNVNISDTGGKKAKLKPLSEGTVLNKRYKISRKIGGGGMGAVYLAEDENLGRVHRAVKEMVQSYIEEEQQDKAVSDFKRESLLLSQLEHPAIPTIYDYFYDESEGRFYLVMKYISGGDLASRLRSAPEGRLDEKTVTEWAIQIADVLDYLHTHKPEQIVYRDLKPSNIMIDGKNGKIMLIDFGIARSVNKEEKGVTAVGTMGYAPPELFSGNVEPRSDIYSLGSTMFHLLTGADPQNNPLLIFDFNKNPRPRQINPSLTDQIEKIVMQAVEYSAERRFRSAVEMRDLLNKHLQNLETGQVTYGKGNQKNLSQPSGEILPVFCGFCGQKIMANDLFCPFCGAKQPLAAAQSGVAKASANFVAAPVTAKLIIVNTSDLIAPAFNLEKESNLIGRRDPMSNIFPEIDLSKYDPQTKISRRHARIWHKDGKFLIEDLGSSNGTVLFSASSESFKLMPQQPRVLTNGDKLKLGDTTLHFIVG